MFCYLVSDPECVFEDAVADGFCVAVGAAVGEVFVFLFFCKPGEEVGGFPVW